MTEQLTDEQIDRINKDIDKATIAALEALGER